MIKDNKIIFFGVSNVGLFVTQTYKTNIFCVRYFIRNTSTSRYIGRTLHVGAISDHVLAVDDKIKRKNMIIAKKKLQFIATMLTSLLIFFAHENLVYCNNIKGSIKNMGL